MIYLQIGIQCSFSEIVKSLQFCTKYQKTTFDDFTKLFISCILDFKVQTTSNLLNTVDISNGACEKGNGVSVGKKRSCHIVIHDFNNLTSKNNVL